MFSDGRQLIGFGNPLTVSTPKSVTCLFYTLVCLFYIRQRRDIALNSRLTSQFFAKKGGYENLFCYCIFVSAFFVDNETCLGLPLGMETGVVKYQQMRSSSFYNATTFLNKARLAGPDAWCSKRDPSFLKIDLKILHNICAVATQGYFEQGYYTTNYLLALGTGDLKNYYKGTVDFQVMYLTEVNNFPKWPMASIEILFKKGKIQ